MFDTLDGKIEDVLIPFGEVNERLNYLLFLKPFHTLANLVLVFGCKFGGCIFILYLRGRLADDFKDANSIEGETSKYAGSKRRVFISDVWIKYLTSNKS